MSTLDDVLAALSNLINPIDSGDGVRIDTHCIYPSNGFVRVHVRGGQSYQVTDEGGAIRDFLSAGVESRDPYSVVRRFVSAQGLELKGAAICVNDVSRDVLPIAVALVANASKDAAELLYSTHRIKKQRDFKQLVRGFLNERFVEHKPKEGTIIGHSQMRHRFDNVIDLGNGRRLIVDAVTNEANSINSAFAANLDVRSRNDPMIAQRIVYDDEENWGPPELSLLAMGAPLVAFSKTSQAFSPEGLSKP